MTGILDLASAHQPLADQLRRHLEQVGVIFERQLASDLSAVNTLCVHVERYHGKMLRPTLVLLSGIASAEDEALVTGRHETLAAVMEMIHLATLVHDDVLDEADVRRGGATVNHLWGNEAAVMLGDFLISNSFHLCSSLGDPLINLEVGEVTNRLCEGELLQLHNRENASLDEETYFTIIDRKTASLISACCRLGGQMSGASEEVCEALAAFGRDLGAAFQIQDDLLDLTGDPQVVGKSLGLDLAKGKMTLPIIRCLAESTDEERSRAMRCIKNHDAAALLALLKESGSIESARDSAADLVSRATSGLASLPDTPARDLLSTMADTVINRSY